MAKIKQLIKNKKVNNVFYLVLAFAFSVVLVVFSLTTVIKTTIFNGNFLNNTLNNSRYYSVLCDEITDDLIDIGDASGLDKSFFEEFVDEVMVREDVQSYINQFYAGEKLSIDTTDFENTLRSAIAEYEKEQGINPENVAKENIDYFIKEASKIYENNVKITYFSIIQKPALSWSFKILLYAIVSGIIAVALGCFIIFTNKWKHIAVKNIYYGVSGAGLFVLILPLFIHVSGIVEKIAVLKHSLNVMYKEIINSVLTDMIVVGMMLLMISLTLIITHHYLRKKAMGT